MKIAKIESYHNEMCDCNAKRWYCVADDGKHFVVDWTENVNGFYKEDGVIPQAEAMAFLTDWQFESWVMDEVAVSYRKCPNDAFDACLYQMTNKGIL